jgi:hypothetical protein
MEADDFVAGFCSTFSTVTLLLICFYVKHPRCVSQSIYLLVYSMNIQDGYGSVACLYETWCECWQLFNLFCSCCMPLILRISSEQIERRECLLQFGHVTFIACGNAKASESLLKLIINTKIGNSIILCVAVN